MYCIHDYSYILLFIILYLSKININKTIEFICAKKKKKIIIIQYNTKHIIHFSCLPIIKYVNIYLKVLNSKEHRILYK